MIRHSSPMRILALVPSIRDTSPGQRFRIEQWEPLLNARNIDIDLQPFEDQALHTQIHRPGSAKEKVRLIVQGFRRRWQLVRRVREYDAVYVFREAALLGPPWIELAIHRRGVPIVFDFDDAIFVPYKSPTNSYLSLLKFPGKTQRLCKIASHVTAGNPYLADYAGRVNERVTIVPTTIDTDKYTPKPKVIDGKPFVIGWSGSHSTVQHLDTLRAILPRLSEHSRFRLRVIGTSQYQLSGVDAESVPWRSETELDDLRRLDIGLMPLPDDPWSKGKCGLKALQYMALGIPTVCSPVGVNTDIIRDGHNGFFASTDDEWIDKLRSLFNSSELRKRLGEAGRETVGDRYSARVNAPRLAEIFEGLSPEAGSTIQRPEMEAVGGSL